MNECPLRESAAAYVLSDLGSSQRTRFESHLAGGCPMCEREMRAAKEIAAGFGNIAAADPPPSLREKLMARVATTPRVPGLLFQHAGLIIARSSELEWQPLGPGVDFKVIHTDTDRRYNTMLVRLTPGARYTAHRHVDVEEVFMISGDMNVAGVIMRAGDYCRGEAGTLHGETSSEAGCVMLVMASPDNEAVA
jgi:quercetin dioxygenase-like cupin family protein